MPSIDSGNCLSHTLFRTLHRSPLTAVNALFFKNDYKKFKHIYTGLLHHSVLKNTAINADPIKNFKKNENMDKDQITMM